LGEILEYERKLERSSERPGSERRDSEQGGARS
jgi:hypothetical protein